MIREPGVWVQAHFARVNSLELEVRVFESDDRGPTPPSLQLLGAALRSLHLAMGGDPTHGEDLIASDAPSTIVVPGGRVQQIRLWPATEDTAQADLIFADCFKRLAEACSSLVGVMGAVDVFPAAVEVYYGPAVWEGKFFRRPLAPPSEGRIVNMFAALHSVGGLGFGNR